MNKFDQWKHECIYMAIVISRGKHSLVGPEHFDGNALHKHPKCHRITTSRALYKNRWSTTMMKFQRTAGPAFFNHTFPDQSPTGKYLLRDWADDESKYSMSLSEMRRPSETLPRVPVVQLRDVSPTTRSCVPVVQPREVPPQHGHACMWSNLGRSPLLNDYAFLWSNLGRSPLQNGLNPGYRCELSAGFYC